MSHGDTAPIQATPTPAQAGTLVSHAKVMRLVFMASLTDLLRRRRLTFLALASALPLTMVLVWRVWGQDMAPVGFFSNLASIVYLKALVYIVALAYGVPTVHDEVEGRTITYLFTRPVSKVAVYAGRLMAVELVAAGLLAASLVLCFVVMVLGNFDVLSGEFIKVYLNYVVVVLVATLVFTALFALFGTVFRKPLAFGFLYAFGWESVVSGVPGNLQTYTLDFHLRNLVYGEEDVRKSVLDAVRFLLTDVSVPAWASVTVLVVALIAFTVVGGRAFSRKEYNIN